MVAYAGCGEGAKIDLQAPAKINLVLRVVGRRQDGYHLLETWMQKVSLYDSLTVDILDHEGVELTCDGGVVPEGQENLAAKAAQLFFSKSIKASGKGARIHLQKNIPVAAGLGGGSSDAGTVLAGLNSYFDHELSQQQLIGLATILGADVPFFVLPARSVLATGIGERMEEVPAPQNCSYLLVNPGFAVSTATVFQKFALTRSDKNSTLTGSQKLRSKGLRLSKLENDLETVTMQLHPIIGEIKTELKRAGADYALMSGSGPTVFGAFTGAVEKRKDTMESAVENLRRKFGEYVYIAE